MESPAISHAKLLASDLLSLTMHPTSPPSFSFPRSNYPISHVEALGIIVATKSNPAHLLFLIDDGTGCVPCVLWLNPRSPPDPADPAPEVVRQQAELVKMGELVRVRGKVGVFRGEVQIVLRDLVVETDPNMETLHWLDCVRLLKDCYDKENC
ncbi:hypothetical protein LUZ60_008239 [Juncus effusus]|nr:hypothetical protein LUZ60_008239 [Juncus effusus]